ncbi:MAG: sensor histidine kinase [Halarcobacter sp.]
MASKLFSNFFNNTIEGIIIIEDGFIVDLNESMLNILNYNSKDDLIGKLATGILMPTINHKFMQYNNSTFEEISLVSKDANIIPAIIKIKDIQDDDKFYKMVFVLDLTDLKEKETLLLEQSRMAAMGEMISMIAHQWRQPLSSIAAAISTLKLRIKMKKMHTEDFEEKVTDIDKYLYYMSKTIDDFRNFFKTNSDKKELISINSVVDMSLELIEKVFINNGVKIINSKNRLQALLIYKSELLQVILNILNNSKDAFKENNITNAIINIDYKENENFQELIISDNAGGIPTNIIDHIFDPYFSTKDKKNGTGLGLYMCKIIIEKHFDGTIIASNSKEGASFTISIKK